nr:hypothetical protein [uncultured Blautia sp.]
MSEQEGYIIVCPTCGKVHNRSIMAESRTHCDRCKTDFYTYLKDGVMITADLAHATGVRDKRIREYTEKLINMYTAVGGK